MAVVYLETQSWSWFSQLMYYEEGAGCINAPYIDFMKERTGFCSMALDVTWPGQQWMC